MARKVQSSEVCGVMIALPGDNEDKPQLSLLAPLVWEQLLDN